MAFLRITNNGKRNACKGPTRNETRLYWEGFLDQAKTLHFLMCKKLNYEAGKPATCVMLWQDFGTIVA